MGLQPEWGSSFARVTQGGLTQQEMWASLRVGGLSLLSEEQCSG